jgi:hypothetical protein
MRRTVVSEVIDMVLSGYFETMVGMGKPTAIIHWLMSAVCGKLVGEQTVVHEEVWK